MKKRVISFFMAVMMLFSVLPVNMVFSRIEALAADEGTFTYQGGNLSFSNKDAAEIIIPKQVAGVDVTSIQANAFLGDTYASLKSVAVLSDTLVIGDKALGYRSDGSKIEDFVLWGNEGSTVARYAEANAIEFKVLSPEISEISTTNLATGASGQDLSKCYTGCDTFSIYVKLNSKTAEDIIWSSSNDKAVTVKAYKISKDSEGNNVAEAQVSVLSKEFGDTCTLYAKTRSGYTKELIIPIKQSASNIDVKIEVFNKEFDRYDEILKKNVYKYEKETNVADSFYKNDLCYVDKGQAIKFTLSCDSTQNDDSIEGYILSQTNLVFDDDYEPTADNEYMFTTNGTTGSTPVTLTFTTNSGVISKVVKVNILQDTKELGVKWNTMTVGSGTQCVQGTSAKLEAVMDSGSTDEVTWSSSDASKAVITSTGTKTANITANGYGNITITCTVKDALSEKRNKSFSFDLMITKRFPYNEISFVDISNNKIDKITMANGNTDQIRITDFTAKDSETPNEQVVYASSNPNVVTVDSESGLLTAKAVGKSTITVVAASGKTASIDVEVYEKASKIEVKNSKNSVVTSEEIPVGQDRIYTCELTPSTSTDEIRWISDDPTSIQVVSDDGNKLQVRALKNINSSVVIRGTATPSNITKNIMIKAVDAINVESMSLKAEGYVRVEEEDGIPVYCVERNTKLTLTGEITPASSNDIIEFWNEGVTNSNYALEVNGLVCSVTPNSTDTILIRLESSNGKRAVCKVRGIVSSTKASIVDERSNVKDRYVIGVNDTLKFRINPDPSNTTDTVAWSVEDQTMASVSTGDEVKPTDFIEVTGLKPGTTKVKALMKSGVTAEVEIQVVIKATSLKIAMNNVPVDNEKGISVLKGDVKELDILEVLPADTTDTEFTWSSKNSYVKFEKMSETDGGRKQKLIAEQSGTDVIVITTNSGVVFNIPVNVLIPATSLDFGEITGAITVNKLGTEATVTAYVRPAGTTDVVSYTVDKPEYVEVVEKRTEIDNVAGVKKITYGIKGKEEGAVKFTVSTLSGCTATMDINVVAIDIATLSETATAMRDSYTFTTEEIKPDNVSISDGNKRLVLGTDYEITGYESNIYVGKGYIVVKGINKYKGTLKVPFNITALTLNTGNAVYTYGGEDHSYVYTKSNVKPKITIKYNGINLVKGTDFDITYPDKCADVGTYFATVTFKGNYTGTVSLSYRVTRKNINNLTIKNASGSVVKTTLPTATYTGLNINPVVSVYDGSKKLTLGKDYTVFYADCRDVTTSAKKATVTLRGMGNYDSSTEKVLKFTIKPRAISKAKIESIMDQKYDGTVKKPALRITDKLSDGSVKNLFEGTDFKLSYSNNKNTGKASVKVTGYGNYTGTRTVYFKILPAKVEDFKQTKATDSSVTVTWKKSAGAVSGYEISTYNVSTGKYSKIGTTTKNTYTKTKLTAGKNYVYAVRAYKKVGSSKYYGEYSNVVNVYVASKAPSSFKLKAVVSGVNATWKASSSANGYEVRYSYDGKKYKKVTTYGTAYSFNGLKKGKKVYVKVRAFRMIYGKTYYSSKYTSTLNAKAK